VRELGFAGKEKEERKIKMKEIVVAAIFKL